MGNRETLQNDNNKGTIMLKKLLLAVACVLICFIIGNVAVYAYSNKTIWDIFFEKNDAHEIKKSDLNKVLDYNGQSYVIDEYTIKLEQTLYEKKSGIGYCIFSVEKENGKPEVKIDKWGDADGDIFGNRFQIDIFQTGSRTYKYEMQGNILYIYVSFALDEGYDGTIDLIDYNEKDKDTIDGYKRYYYRQKGTNFYQQYKDGDNDVIVTPIGVTVEGNSIGDVELKFHSKDGEITTIVDTEKEIGIGGSHECTEDERTRKQFIFGKIKDIENIDYILFNGKKLKL